MDALTFIVIIVAAYSLGYKVGMWTGKARLVEDAEKRWEQRQVEIDLISAVLKPRKDTK